MAGGTPEEELQIETSKPAKEPVKSKQSRKIGLQASDGKKAAEESFVVKKICPECPKTQKR